MEAMKFLLTAVTTRVMLLRTRKTMKGKMKPVWGKNLHKEQYMARATAGEGVEGPEIMMPGDCQVG